MQDFLQPLLWGSLRRALFMIYWHQFTCYILNPEEGQEMYVNEHTIYSCERTACRHASLRTFTVRHASGWQRRFSALQGHELAYDAYSARLRRLKAIITTLATQHNPSCGNPQALRAQPLLHTSSVKTQQAPP